jgi:hypothetical protein
MPRLPVTAACRAGGTTPGSIVTVLTAGMLSAMLMPSPELSAATMAVFACACAMEMRCDAMHRDLMP